MLYLYIVLLTYVQQRMMDLEKEIEFKRKEDGLIVAVEEANKLKQILDQIK